MDEFVAETKEKLENVMQRLGWDLETLKKQRPTSVCRYDDKHGVLSQGLVKHELLCSLRKQGLSKKEAASVHDTGFCYAESPQVTSFSLSEQEKQNVLMSRCINDRYEIGGLDVHRLLTPPERLALYEYMIEKVRFENKLHKIPDDQLLFLEDDGDEDGKKEGLSIAEVRDLKRRRQTYRAKNVHVTKKSYTMVMREVLENQFKILEHRQKADAELEQELRRNPPKFRDAREGSVRSHREGSVRQRESSVRDGRSGSVRGQREGSSRHDVEREARTRDVPRAPDIQAPREREPSRARGDGERWRHDKFDEKQPQPLPRIDSRVVRSMSRSHDRRETRDQMDVPRDFGVERAQSRDHQERSRDYGDVRDRLGYPHEKREYSRDHDRTRGHDVTRDSSRARYYDGTPDSSGARDHDGTRDSSRARDHDGKRDSSRTRDHDGTRDSSRTRDHERTRGSSRTPSGKYKDHYDKSARAHGDRTGHHSRDQTRDTPPRGTVSSQVELHYDDEPDVKESSSRLKHRSRSRSKRSKSGDRRKSRDSRKSREGSSKKKKSTKKKSRKRKRSATEDESTERKAKRHKHKQKKKKKKRSDSPLVSDVDELVDSDDVDIPSDVDSDHVSGNDVGVGSDVVGESDVQESEEEEEEEEEEEKEEEEGEAEEEEEEEENVSVDEEEENVSVDYEEAEHLSVDEDELSEPSLSPSP